MIDVTKSSKSSVWKQPRLIRVSCALSPLFHLPFLSLYPPNPSTSARRGSHSPSLHNVFASSCLAFNLTPHSPQYPLLHRSVFAVAGVRLRRGGERGWEGEESRLESISQLRHQCFAVGTLLIALLYNYSTSTPSFWLLHQSCFQFFSRFLLPFIPSLPLLPCFFYCYFHPSVCVCVPLFSISHHACVPKLLTNRATHNRCVYRWHVRCIDTLISSMQRYHILPKEKDWLTHTHSSWHTPLRTVTSTCCMHPLYASHVPLSACYCSASIDGCW